MKRASASLSDDPEPRELAFADLGHSGHQTTARDMEPLLEQEWADSNVRFDRSGCDAGAMIDRPGPLGHLDGYFAATRIAHEYVADLHRELVELDATDDHPRELLHESAVLTIERMPALKALRSRQNQIVAELLSLVS